MQKNQIKFTALDRDHADGKILKTEGGVKGITCAPNFKEITCEIRSLAELSDISESKHHQLNQ